MVWECGQPQSYCPFGCPGARLLKSHASRWIPILAGFTRRFASHVRRNGERIVVKRGDLGKNHGGFATAPLQGEMKEKASPPS